MPPMNISVRKNNIFFGSSWFELDDQGELLTLGQQEGRRTQMPPMNINVWKNNRFFGSSRFELDAQGETSPDEFGS